MSNAFDWKGKPSVILASGDHSFRATHEGISLSQSASKLVRTRTLRHGFNPGTIPGLSPSADRQVLSPQERRRRAAR